MMVPSRLMTLISIKVLMLGLILHRLAGVSAGMQATTARDDSLPSGVLLAHGTAFTLAARQGTVSTTSSAPMHTTVISSANTTSHSVTTTSYLATSYGFHGPPTSSSMALPKYHGSSSTLLHIGAAGLAISILLAFKF